jgi:phosphoribosylanthranilate isomerase
MTRVKICGLTAPDQARAVAEMGAWAIGMVFTESKRRVTPGRAAEIVAAAGEAVEKVGVFVDSSPEEILDAVQQAGLTRVQLHGRESPEIVGRITVPCWKAFRIRDEGSIDRIRSWLAALPKDVGVEAILLDAFVAGRAGGTGERFGWDVVVRARQQGALEGFPPIILAGGLDPDNVGEAIDALRPWAVDVSSGVEASPGVKDLRKVEAFLKAAREGSLPRSEEGFS